MTLYQDLISEKAYWCDTEYEAREYLRAWTHMEALVVPNTKLPVPDNPEHVDNMKSLSLLESQAYEGIDRSLEISLFEYGVASIRTSKSWIFVHNAAHTRGLFSRSTVPLNVQPKIEWNWVNGEWDQFEDENGDLPPLPQLVFDLVNYYGAICVFGEHGLEFEILNE